MDAADDGRAAGAAPERLGYLDRGQPGQAGVPVRAERHGHEDLAHVHRQGFHLSFDTYTVQRKPYADGPRYRALYINPGYVLAIHGYPSVPTYPASDGCIRLPMWEMDALGLRQNQSHDSRRH